MEQRQHLSRRHDGRRQDHRRQGARAPLGAATSSTPTGCSSSAPACPIATIFEIEGEAGFRAPRIGGARRARRAARARDRHRRRRGARRGEPSRHARASGTVVYLRARLEQPAGSARAATPRRPLLATADPRATLAELLEKPAIRSTARPPTSSWTPDAQSAAHPGRSRVARRAAGTQAPRRRPAHERAHTHRRARRAQLPDPHRRGPRSTQRDLFAPHVDGRRAAA